MPAALRLHSLALPVADPEAADRFYRWTFRLEPAPDAGGVGESSLGWGREDRLRLVPDAGSEAVRVGLRMPALALDEALAWCAEVGLKPVALAAPPVDAEAAAGRLPSAAVETVQDARLGNMVRVTARGWADLALELSFPVPGADLGRRRAAGPFLRRSDDWSGLETPGLLGATLAGPDLPAGRAFWQRLGARPLEEGDAEQGPLRLGDQQLILEERERPAISGIALLIREASLGEVSRTLSHLRAEFRHSGNRLLARDPDGRVVFVQGVRSV